jgi:SAM-dependent methyltransferase
VLDIIPGENVDVVGDAHNLSSYFEADSFDYIVSTSVFEHLSMPWKVALEMNKVLKPGGKAMIQTHQSIGMHDLPWDFFRFSDSAWDGIFNKKSGFKIIERVLDHENFILPFIIRPDQIDAEYSAGFEVSLVVVEKISNTLLEWNVNQVDILETNYPTHEDGNNPKFRELLARGLLKVEKFFSE